MSRIVVVDDDPGMRAAFTTLLGARGHEVTTYPDAERALEALTHDPPELVLLDVFLPGMSGLDAIRRIKAAHERVPVVMMTGSNTTDIAIEASKLGAFDYHLKPFDPEAMLEVVDRALAVRRAEGSPPPSATAFVQAPGTILGDGPRMQELYKAIGRVAPTDATVLVRGESGTGKELVARAIHSHSHRRDRPFVVVNCVAIPDTLLESELFGFERGAFTGAVARRRGKFELAEGGTVLLDEIGDIPLALQAKILRVLQERTFERLGGGESIVCDVRIVAATNRDLEAAIRDGRFREDLYHRLDVVTIDLPPLRERRKDLPLLVRTFLHEFAAELGFECPPLSDGAMSALLAHPWPGNVRELRHCLHRALIFSRGLPIQEDDIRRALRNPSGPRAAPPAAAAGDLQEFLRAYLEREAGAGCHERLMDGIERELLLEAMRRAAGNQTRAAEALGMPRPTLYAKLQKHGIRTSVVVGRDDLRRDPPEPA